MTIFGSINIRVLLQDCIDIKNFEITEILIKKVFYHPGHKISNERLTLYNSLVCIEFRHKFLFFAAISNALLIFVSTLSPAAYLVETPY